jgi:BlaI family penicillinase repressor
MTPTPDISDSEWSVMEALWAASPQTASELAKTLRPYLPAVKRESCVRAEGESFMQRIFGGAAKPLLVHFAQNTKLTAEEVRELKKILDQRLNP